MTENPWKALEIPDRPTARSDDGLRRCYQRLFGSADGRAVLRDLERRTLETTVPGDQPSGVHQQMEGQRSLVLKIRSLAKVRVQAKTRRV